MDKDNRVAIGVVGFGKLGQFLVESILKKADVFQLAFVYNRTVAAIRNHPSINVADDLIIQDLNQIASFQVDLIVEVSHPEIVIQYLEMFLKTANCFVASPTAFADSRTDAVLQRCNQKAADFHTLYIPSGALWGAQNIQHMARLDSITKLRITMKKHPSAFKLKAELDSKLQQLRDQEGEVVLYDGAARELCKQAPNNVNTIAAACLACCEVASLGFDGVEACLISDKSLDCHIVNIQVVGKNGFTVDTNRVNPAARGVVTGSATFNSFLASLLSISALNQGKGICFC